MFTHELENVLTLHFQL